MRVKTLLPTYIVGSSTIDAVAHQLGKLYVRFKSGSYYSYEAVPYDIYDALKKAESAGQFLHRMVKGKFAYTKLESDPFMAGMG